MRLASWPGVRNTVVSTAGAVVLLLAERRHPPSAWGGRRGTWPSEGGIQDNCRD